jgi:peptide/nickel transport system permease protein
VGRELLRRAVHGATTIAIVATLTFVLLHLAPGDPLAQDLDNTTVPPAVRQHQRELAGFDRPIAEQLVRYLANVAQGELGYSWSLHRPVGRAVAAALPNTLVLVGTALACSFLLGITLGVVEVAWRGGRAGRLLNTATAVVASLPEFWLAVVLALVFAYRLSLFPISGTIDVAMHDFYSPAGRALDRLRHLVLPVGTLTLLYSAIIARYQRAALLEVLEADWLRTARSKGLTEGAILVRHALRNALVPIASLLGLALPALVAGAVFVEVAFGWPGMGRLAIDGVNARDYELVTAAALLGAVLVVVGSILADTLQRMLDPRLRTA